MQLAAVVVQIQILRGKLRPDVLVAPDVPELSHFGCSTLHRSPSALVAASGRCRLVHVALVTSGLFPSVVSPPLLPHLHSGAACLCVCVCVKAKRGCLVQTLGRPSRSVQHQLVGGKGGPMCSSIAPPELAASGASGGSPARVAQAAPRASRDRHADWGDAVDRQCVWVRVGLRCVEPSDCGSPDSRPTRPSMHFGVRVS